MPPVRVNTEKTTIAGQNLCDLIGWSFFNVANIYKISVTVRQGVKVVCPCLDSYNFTGIAHDEKGSAFAG